MKQEPARRPHRKSRHSLLSSHSSAGLTTRPHARTYTYTGQRIDRSHRRQLDSRRRILRQRASTNQVVVPLNKTETELTYPLRNTAILHGARPRPARATGSRPAALCSDRSSDLERQPDRLRRLARLCTADAQERTRGAGVRLPSHIRCVRRKKRFTATISETGNWNLLQDPPAEQLLLHSS